MQSLGYCHVNNFLQGRIGVSDAKRLMKRDTRRYAKRQITWFRQEQSAVEIKYSDSGDILDIIPEIHTIMKNTQRHK